jgi:hypothetical protein
LSGTKVDGAKTDIWLRLTVCFRKIDGRWKITHEHESVPFYMDGSDKAALDLKPWRRAASHMARISNCSS